MQTKPFPIPVVAEMVGPGSQTEDDTLDYLTMPQGMATFQPPMLPEPEALAGAPAAVAVLQAALAALNVAARGEPTAPIALDGLDAPALALVNQVLGEGEVSAQVLADGLASEAMPGAARVRVQESVFAGVWRVLRVLDDGQVRDAIEVGAIPAVLLEAAHDDGRAERPGPQSAPDGVFNAQPVLVELADQRQQWQPGRAAHVVNLSLLPMTPLDIGFLDHVLGTGRVLLLSRGYGNCRITNTRVPNTWRIVYYNSQDQVILNTVEVCRVPEVACAAPEDLADSAGRLTEVMAWVRQDA